VETNGRTDRQTNAIDLFNFRVMCSFLVTYFSFTVLLYTSFTVWTARCDACSQHFGETRSVSQQDALLVQLLFNRKKVRLPTQTALNTPW